MNKNLLRVFFVTLLSVLLSTSAFSQKADVQVSTNADLEAAIQNPAIKVIEVVEPGYYEYLSTDFDRETLLIKGRAHTNDDVKTDRDDPLENCCIYNFQTGYGCLSIDETTGGTATVTIQLITSLIPNPNHPEPVCPDENEGFWFVEKMPAEAVVEFYEPTATASTDPFVRYDEANGYQYFNGADESLRYLAELNVKTSTPGFYRFVNNFYATPHNPSSSWVGASGLSFTLHYPTFIEFPNAPESFCEDDAEKNAFITLHHPTIELSPTEPLEPLNLEWHWEIDGNDVTGNVATNPNSIVNLNDIGEAGGVVFPFNIDDLEDLSCGAHTLTVTVDAQRHYADDPAGNPLYATICDETKEYSFYIYDTPTLTVDAPESVCGLEANFQVYPTVDCNNGQDLVATLTAPNGTVYTPTIDGFFDVTVDDCGVKNFLYKVTNGSCYTETTVTIEFFDKPDITAIAVDKACGFTANLDATVNLCNGTTGTPTFEWSWLDKPADAGNIVFTPENAEDTEVEVDACGEYLFQLKATSGDCVGTKTVTVYFYGEPSIKDATVSDVCITDDQFNMDASFAANCQGAQTATFTWSVPTGATVSDVNDPQTAVTFNACGEYEFVATVVNGDCSTSTTVVVRVYDKPVISGVEDMEVCGTEVTINPSYTVACYEGANGFATDGHTGSKEIHGDGINLLFPNEVNPGDENVELTFQIDAHSDDSEYIKTVRLVFPEGITPVSGSALVANYSWGYYLDAPTSITENSIEWSGLGSTGFGIFGPNFNNVDFTVNVNVAAGAPAGDFAIETFVIGEVYGAEPHVIEGTTNITILGGNPNPNPNPNPTPAGTSLKAYILDGGNMITPTTNGDYVLEGGCGTHNYTYVVENGPCRAEKEFTVKYFDKPEVYITAQSQVCGLTVELFGGHAIQCTNSQTPTYTWSKVSGPGNVTFTPNANDDEVEATVTKCGKYEFRLSVTNGECSSSTTKTVEFFKAPVVNITNEEKVCIDQLPLEIGSDVEICNNLSSVTPTYQWSATPINTSGEMTFSSDNIANPEISVSECGQYELKLVVTHGTCETTATSTINIYDVPVINDIDVPTAVCGYQTTVTIQPTAECPGCDDKGAKDLETGEVIYVENNELLENTDNVVLTFTLNAVVTAGEKVRKVVLNFPADLEVVSSENIVLGGNELVASVNGQQITYSGLIEAGTPVNFDVVCNTKGNGLELVEFDVKITNPTGSGTGTFGTNGYTKIYVGFVPPVDTCLEGLLESLDPNVTVTAGTVTNTWNIEASECGTYEFLYTAYNAGGCKVTKTYEITFYEKPELTITGPTDVNTCSEIAYTVENTACEVASQTVNYNWTVDQDGNMSYYTGETVTITFNQNPGDVNITVTGMINMDQAGTTGNNMCEATATATITKKEPIFEGQIKYWNKYETYMPTPFKTNDYGTTPQDYFYVSLLKGEDSTNVSTCGEVGNFTEVKTVKAQPKLTEDLNELMSYFKFNIPTSDWGCDYDLKLQVWDGGLYYHDPMPTGTVAGTQLGNNYTYNHFGSVNATDALILQLMAANTDLHSNGYNFEGIGLNTDVPPYGYYSHSVADVNNTDPYTAGGITALDALTAKYRSVGLIANYPDNGSDNDYAPNYRVTGRMVDNLPEMTWPTAFDNDTLRDICFGHSGTDYQYFTPAVDHKYTSEVLPWRQVNKNKINLYYQITGDINSTYIPANDDGCGNCGCTPCCCGGKLASQLTYNGTLHVEAGDVITIPVKAKTSVKANAISLMMNYRNDLVEVISTNYNEDDVNINQEKGIVNIAWYNKDNARTFNEGDVIAEMKVKVLADIDNETEIFTLAQELEMADATATVIEGVMAETVKLASNIDVNKVELTANNYPNPFRNETTISYVLPEQGQVKIEVYNNQGILIATLVDAVQDAGAQSVVFNKNVTSGIYFYNITVEGENSYSLVKKMIVK